MESRIIQLVLAVIAAFVIIQYLAPLLPSPLVRLTPHKDAI